MRLDDLPGTIGTEVVGLDVELGSVSGGVGPGDVAGIDALRDALARRHLLLVRSGPLPGEVQVAFAARFGPLVPERRLWGYVSNVRADGIVREGALCFHSDFAFTPSPVAAICLHALDVARRGAPTRFADAVNAARLLPRDLRRRLEGRRVLNVYDFALPNDRPMRRDDLAPGSPTCEHPAVGRHPGTGETVVMANELHTDSIVGVPRDESAALLADLFAVLYDPGNVYEHSWSRGDTVLWDNVALHHGRPDIPRDEPRTLQRVTLGAYTPAELVPNLAELLAARRPAPGRRVRPGSECARTVGVDPAEVTRFWSGEGGHR